MDVFALDMSVFSCLDVSTLSANLLLFGRVCFVYTKLSLFGRLCFGYAKLFLFRRLNCVYQFMPIYPCSDVSACYVCCLCMLTTPVRTFVYFFKTASLRFDGSALRMPIYPCLDVSALCTPNYSCLEVFALVMPVYPCTVLCPC